MGKSGKISAKNILFLLAALFWCAFLVDSDARYEPYLFVGAAGFLLNASSTNSVRPERKRDRIPACVLSMLLSVCVAAANYSLFPVAFSSIYGVLLFLLFLLAVLAGGYFLFRQIFDWIYANAQKTLSASQPREERKSFWVFAASVGSVVLVDCVFLFGMYYPGVLTADGIDQIGQILSGEYSNHHPYFHTQIIRFWVLLGERIFGSLIAGVATYSVFSIVLLAVSFGYAVCTVYQYTGSRKVAGIILGWYLLMPFHIIYSFTMWKDVPFAAMVLLFVVGVFRLTGGGMEKKGRLDTLVVLLSAAGVCLLRSNGFLAFAISVAAFCVFFGEKKKRLAFLLIGVLCGCFVLKHPVLEALNVSQPDPIESLSVPVQQIGGAISAGAALSEEQYELLSQIVDVERIGETYVPYISDPLKNLVRETNNQQFLVSHKTEFVRLYVDLGIASPAQYIKAWIELTKGYWNGGYPYWIWTMGVGDNPFGIVHTVNSPKLYEFFKSYLSFFEAPLVCSFLCIGLYSWLLVFAAYSAWVKRDWKALYLPILPGAVILTLLVATPVYSEFRYAYSVMCTIPVILAVSFWPKTHKGNA